MIRVLLLDDDKAFGESTARWLQNHLEETYTLTTTTPEQARKAVLNADHAFDIFLIDQRLGSLTDGVDVLQELRQLSPGTEAIIFTGLDDPEIGLRAYQAGAFRYLAKPFSLNELVMIVKSLIEWRKTRSEHSRLKILAEVAEDAQRALSLQEVAQVVVRGGRQLGFNHAQLWQLQQNILTFVKADRSEREPRQAPRNLSLTEFPSLAIDRSSHEPVVLQDQALAEQLFGEPKKKASPGVWLSISLSSGEHGLGLIILKQSNRMRSFNADQPQALQLFGNHVAAALSRARLYELEQRKNKELEIFSTISQLITNRAASDDLNALFQEIHIQVGKLLDARNFRLVLLNKDTNKLHERLHVVNGRIRPVHWNMRQNGLIRHLITQNEPLLLTEGDKAYRRDRRIRGSNRLSLCWLGVPLRVAGKAIGAIIVQNNTKPFMYDKENQRILMIFADQVAGIIQTSLLKEQGGQSHSRLEVLHRASVEMMGLAEQDDKKLWHAALTIATADYGLGFNRAMVFLKKGEKSLIGCMGIGHFDREATRKAWFNDRRIHLRFDGYLKRLKRDRLSPTPVQEKVVGWELTLPEGGCIFQNVMKTGKRERILAADVTRQLPPEFVQAFHLNDYAILPLRAGNNMVGIAIVDNHYTKDPLPDPSLNYLESLLSHTVLTREAVYQRRVRDQLIELNYDILAGTEHRTLKQTLDQICVASQSITSADCASIYPLVPNQEIYEYDVENIGAVGWKHPLCYNKRPRQRGITAHILRYGTLAVSNIDHYHGRFDGQKLVNHEFLQREEVRAFIGTTVHDAITGEMLGVLYLDYRDPQSFNDEIRQAESFASLAAVAIRNIRTAQDHQTKTAKAEAQTEATERELNILREISDEALKAKNIEQVILALLNAGKKLLRSTDIRVKLLLPYNLDQQDQEQYDMHHQYSLDPNGNLRHPTLIARSDKTRNAFDVDITFAEDVIGIFRIELTKTETLEADRQDTLKRFARVAALALHNVQGWQHLSKERERLKATLGITEAVGTTLDISQTIRKITTTLHELFPSTTVCVLTYNRDKSCLEFTPASREFYHIDNPAHIGITHVPLDDSSLVGRAAHRFMKHQEIREENVGNVTDDPSYLPLRLSTVSELCWPLVSNERLLGVLALESEMPNAFDKDAVVLVRSVGQQIAIALNRALDKADLDFNTTISTITAWAADLAHAIIPEVLKIRYGAEWLLGEQKLSKEGKKAVAEVEQSAARLAEAIKDSDPGRFQKQEVIRLDSWLLQVVTEIASKQPVPVTVDFDGLCGDLTIRTLPFALKSALRHLIRNAREAVAGPTVLKIQTLQVSEHFVEIRIQDNGPGVPPDIRPLIFRQRTQRKGHQGGLGLMLVRSIVTTMDGTIQLLTDEPRKGAVFALTLPISPQRLYSEG